MEPGEAENIDLSQEPNDPSSVYTLDLSSHKLCGIPKYVRKYKNCKSLNLSCNTISTIKENDLSSLLQLKELKLYSNRFKTISGLQSVVKLEELQLQFNSITSIEKSLKNNRNLLFLRLDSNKLSSITVSDFCTLSRLTYLDVSSNRLDNVNCVNTLPSLERLFCTHNLLTKLPNLSVLKKLKEVDFSSNSLIDLGGLKGCKRLEIIVVDGNKIKKLASIGSSKSLQELKMSCNQIQDFKHVSESFNSLELLEVSFNRIESIEQIKHLFKLSSLRELYIQGNPLLTDSAKKTMVYELLQNNLQLHIIDGNEVNKEKDTRSATPTLRSMSAIPSIRPMSSTPIMRPMSACHMISERSIKDQMEFSIMQMNEIEEKIKLQYDVVKSSLMELPQGKPQLVNKRYEIDLRPSSKCSSRARLNEAKAFAEKHFHLEE